MNNQTDSRNHIEILVRQNIALAKRATAEKLGTVAICRIRSLTMQFGFSWALGDFQYLNGTWYVTHAGLLRLASRKRCVGILTVQIREFCDPSTSRWFFRATVYKSPSSKGFVGYGDADPSNVSPLVRGSEMRVAETRAVNRALRKAYGIGLCSVDELGTFSPPSAPVMRNGNKAAHSNGNSSGSARPRLRDQLCLLIRQHRLDPALVKRYAADFCGTETLRDAGRDLVESFITTLAEQAAKDRGGLICKLNSYGGTETVKS